MPASTPDLVGPGQASPIFQAGDPDPTSTLLYCLRRGLGLGDGPREKQRTTLSAWGGGFIPSPSARTRLADLASTRRVADGEGMNPAVSGASAPIQEDDEDQDDMHRPTCAAKSPDSGGQQQTALHSTASLLAQRPGRHRQLVNDGSAEQHGVVAVLRARSRGKPVPWRSLADSRRTP